MLAAGGDVAEGAASGSGGIGVGDAGAPAAEAGLGSSENGEGDDGDEAAGMRAEEADEGDADGRPEATGQTEEPYGTDAPTGCVSGRAVLGSKVLRVPATGFLTRRARRDCTGKIFVMAPA